MRPESIALTLSGGRRLDLRAFAGEALVLAIFARAGTMDFREATLARLRAELRGLGAALVLIAPDGVWCFRADDDVEWLAHRDELSPNELAIIFAAHALSATPKVGAATRALYLIDHAERVVFERRDDDDDGQDNVESLVDALAASGRALVARPRSFILSRREALISSLVAGFTLALLDGCGKGGVARPATLSGQTAPSGGEIDVTLDVNGARHAMRIDPRVTLLDALRERLGLTGTKKGCDQGQCGACTVLVNDRRIKSCLTLAAMVEGDKVITIEGLADGDRLHPMQQAFITEDAFQCGYCTPGQIMSPMGLMRERRVSSAAEIREHMSGNICRCGAYPNIVAAIQKAARES
jgi:xanthine dehydrogenase YagT iron-sulfur-binding subunit